MDGLLHQANYYNVATASNLKEAMDCTQCLNIPAGTLPSLPLDDFRKNGRLSCDIVSSFPKRSGIEPLWQTEILAP